MDYRAIRAARVVIADVLGVLPGERVVISRDTSAGSELAELLGAAACDAGAIPVEIRVPRASHPGAPVSQALAGIAGNADVWIELNEVYILGTDAHHRAEAAGLRRFYSMSGMTIADLVDLELDVDRAALIKLGRRLADITSGCTELLVTCAHGTRFRASCVERMAAPDTTTMPLGQTHIAPIEGSLTGTLVFDGSAYPPGALGVLRETISIDLSEGAARVTSDTRESRLLRSWQASLANPDIYRLNHFSYGYHPRVPLPTGRLVADERVFGGLCIGFGPPQPYACHMDLTILDATVIIDGVTVQENGEYADPEARELARAIGAPGY